MGFGNTDHRAIHLTRHQSPSSWTASASLIAPAAACTIPRYNEPLTQVAAGRALGSQPPAIPSGIQEFIPHCAGPPICSKPVKTFAQCMELLGHRDA